jgi:hypothetical protein
MKSSSRNRVLLAAAVLWGAIGWGYPLFAETGAAAEGVPSTWPGAGVSESNRESSMLVSESGAQGVTAGEPLLVPAVPTTPAPMPIPNDGFAPQDVAPQEELVAPQDGPVVHPVAKIDYDVTRKARKRFGGSPFVELTMITQNPADGCFYEFPMCLPACCTGEPQVTSYCGLFGRGVVVYCYECGLEIEVKFRLRGDVEVEYGT